MHIYYNALRENRGLSTLDRRFVEMVYPILSMKVAPTATIHTICHTCQREQPIPQHKQAQQRTQKPPAGSVRPY